jgi:hypothetical protein
MTKVILSEDCGNSPKNMFLKNLTIAHAKGDLKFILSSVTDEIVWNFIGDKTYSGINEFTEYVKEMSKEKAAEIIIHQISTHGVSGAVNGEVKLKNGELYGFCDVYRFSNAKGEKVKSITSYIIKIG